MSDNLYVIISKDSVEIAKNNYFKLYISIFGENCSMDIPSLNIKCLENLLDELLSELTGREEKVLRLRFGLDDGRPETLLAIGRKFNVSREYIRQFVIKILIKLKHPSKAPKIYKNVYINEWTRYDDELYSKYKTYLIELLKADIDVYNSNKNNNTLFIDNILKEKYNIQSDKNTEQYEDEVNCILENISIEELNLSVRAYNCLKRAGIENLHQLASFTEEDFIKVRNLGRNSMKEVKEAISRYGISTSTNNSNRPTIVFDIDDFAALFEMDIPLDIIYTLLCNGYIDAKQIMNNKEKVSKILSEHNLKPKELFERIEKCTQYSIIAELDIKLLNYISSYNILNYKKFKDNVINIEDDELRRRIEGMIYGFDRNRIDKIIARPAPIIDKREEVAEDDFNDEDFDDEDLDFIDEIFDDDD